MKARRTMYEVIVSPFLDTCLLLRPGQPNAAKISRLEYAQLQAARADEHCPDWLSDTVMKLWATDVRGKLLRDVAVVRAPSVLGYGRASYEINLGCNYDCEHCYLGLKEFAGLGWPERETILDVMRSAGVLWLQLTGGEPTIDRFWLMPRFSTCLRRARRTASR